MLGFSHSNNLNGEQLHWKCPVEKGNFGKFCQNARIFSTSSLDFHIQTIYGQAGTRRRSPMSLLQPKSTKSVKKPTNCIELCLRLAGFLWIQAEILGLLHDVSLTQRPGAAEMTSHRRWAVGLEMTSLAQFQTFHGQLLQYVKNLSTNSRALSILHSKSHDMVRCGPANRSAGLEVRTNRRRGWGRAPSYPPSWGQSDNGLHEIGLIASSQDCVST